MCIVGDHGRFAINKCRFLPLVTKNKQNSYSVCNSPVAFILVYIDSFANTNS